MMVKNPLRRPYFLSPEGWTLRLGMEKLRRFTGKFYERSFVDPHIDQWEHLRGGWKWNSLGETFFWGGSRENGQESKMRTFSFLAKVHANHWLAWRYVTGQSRSGTHWGVVVDYQINWSHSTRIWYIVYRSTVAIAGVYRAFSLWKSVMFPEWSTVNGCFRSLKDGMWPNHHSNPNRTPKIRGDTKHHHVWNETPKVKKQLVWDPF